MGRLYPGLGALLAAVLCGCVSSADTDSVFDKRAAARMNTEFQSKWNESEGGYRYTYAYWPGLFSETQYGECIVGASVSCLYTSAIADTEKSTHPGRMSGLFDKMDSILSAIVPDSVRSENARSYSILEWTQMDTRSVPYGYTVYFNEERGYIDSVFFLPFGPNLRVRSLSRD